MQDMELEALRAKWSEYDRNVGTSLRLNLRLLRDTYTRRVRSAMRRLAAGMAIESLSLLLVIVLLGEFLYQNWSAPRFFWAGVALDLFAIAALIAQNVQIGMALTIDYGRPVADIQRRLESLSVLRIRRIQGIFFTGALVWVPMLIVVMKAFLGVDAYRAFGTAYITANVLFGFACLALAIGVSRKYGKRVSNSSFGRRLMKDLAGYNLNAAAGFLQTLSEFEQERA